MSIYKSHRFVKKFTRKHGENPYYNRLRFDRRRSAYTAVFLLSIILVWIFGAAIYRLLDNSPPFHLVELNDEKLEGMLRNTNKLTSLLILYNSSCESCADQLKYYEPLFNRMRNGQIDFIVVSLDDNPSEAASFIRKFSFAANAVPYYVAPDMRKAFFTAIEKTGAKPLKTLPFSALYDNRGRLIAQYSSLATAKDIQSILNILLLNNNQEI